VQLRHGAQNRKERATLGNNGHVHESGVPQQTRQAFYRVPVQDKTAPPRGTNDTRKGSHHRATTQQREKFGTKRSALR